MLTLFRKPKTSSDVKLPTTRHINRPMTTEKARRAAMDTTEVLEHILSFLPQRTLFVVQRVSRQWKDLIARSSPIQEKMFLRFRTKRPEIWMLMNPKPRPSELWRTNPIEGFLDRKFKTVSASEVEPQDWESPSPWTQHLFTPLTLNPLLFRRHGGLDAQWIESRDYLPVVYLAPRANIAQHISLRDSYLTDPPCKECSVEISFDADGSNRWLGYVTGYAEIRSDKPLTLGDIIDRTLESRMWVHVPNMGRFSGARLQEITVAEKLDNKAKEYGCETTFQAYYGMDITLALKENTIRPLLLTDDEYLCYRPT